MSSSQYSDRDWIDFNEEYELNYILRKFGKRQSKVNRDALVNGILPECKEKLGDKTRISHEDFYPYLEKHLRELE